MLESTSLTEQKNLLQKELRSERFLFLTGQEADFAQRQGEMRAKIDQVDLLEGRIVVALDNEQPGSPGQYGQSCQYRRLDARNA